MDCVLYMTSIAAVFAVALGSSKVVEREITTLKKHVFRLTSEVGVTPRGRTSYVFKVKSCDTAIIALSNIRNIKKNRGRYFLLYLGRNYNTHISLLDSCFGCTPKVVVKKRVLQCNVFQPFWLKWDNMGTVSMGEGRKVGQKALISYTSPRPFLVSFSQLTSLYPPTIWKFLLKEKVIFVAPHPDGSTMVKVKENVVLGSVVYQTVVRPEVDVILANSSHFKISGTKIQIIDNLDFEREQYHILLLRTKNLNISVTLTVLVEDVNDESPEVVLREDVRIPEELPVGFIIRDVFETTDKDATDSLSYGLEGADKTYINVSPSGQIQIRRRIDRDGPDGRHQLNDLQLIVEDSANHTSTHNLSVTVSDINDNKPICIPTYKSVHINQTMTNDKPVVRIQCTDLDQDGRDPVSLHIVSRSDSADYSNTFWLSGSDLFADVDLLRNDTLHRDSKVYVIKLLAVDIPVNGRTNSANIAIIINLQQDNTYIPEWVLPQPIDENRFPDIIISETVPVGTIIQHFLAQDRDSRSSVTYGISSVASGDGKTSIETFRIEERTGFLRTAVVLDSNTNSCMYYDIIITATDGEHIISGYAKVILKENSDFPPRFVETLRVVSINTYRNLAKLSLQLDFHNLDTNVTLTLADRNRRYFSLSRYSDKWHLMMLPEDEPREDSDFPPVIVVTATDNSSPARTSRVVVIIADLPCPLPVSHKSSVTSSEFTVPQLPVTKHVSVPTASLSRPGTYNTRSTSYHSTPVCLPSNVTVQNSSNFGFYLLLLCAGEGLLIVIIVLFLLAILCCRICGTSSRREKSKNQCGSGERLLNYNVTQPTVLVSISRSISPSLVCQVDIIEETTRVHHKKITVNRANLKTPESSPSTVCDGSKTKAKVLNENNPNNTHKNNPKMTTKRGLLQLDDVEIPTDNQQTKYDDGLKVRSRDKTSTKDACIQVVRNHESEIFSDTGQLREKSTDPNYISRHSTDTVRVKTGRNKDERNVNNCAFEGTDMVYGHNAYTVPLISTKDAWVQVIMSPQDELYKETEGHSMKTSIEANCLTRQCSVTDFVVEATQGNKDQGTYITNHTLVDDVKPNPLADTNMLIRDNINALPLDCMSPTSAVRLTKEQFGKLIKATDEQKLPPDKHSLGADDGDMVSGDSLCDMHQDQLPTTSKLELNEQLFITVLQDDESCLNSEDILEVDKKELKKLMISHENNVSSYEASIKAFPQGLSATIHIVFLPRSHFLRMISCRSKHCCCNVDEVVEVMTSTLGDEMGRNEAWFRPIATCHTKGTIFLTQKMFLQLLCYFKCKIVQLSVDKKQELDDSGSTTDLFWEENTMAVSLTTGSMYINQLALLQLENRTPQDSAYNGIHSCQNELLSVSLNQLTENNTHINQGNLASCRNELLRNCIGVDPLTGLVYLYRNVYTNVTNVSLNPTEDYGDCGNDIVSVSESLVSQLLSENSEGKMVFKSYVLHKYALAFNETCEQFYFWQSNFREFLSSVEKHVHKFEQFDKRPSFNSPKCKYPVPNDQCRARRAGATAAYSYIEQSCGNDETDLKWSNPFGTSNRVQGKRRSALTITDDVDDDEDVKHLSRIKLRKPRKNKRKLATTWSWKKNRKIKPWDKEVRKRLYVTVVGNNSSNKELQVYRKKKQIDNCPENVNDTLPSTNKSKKRKRKTKK